MPEEDDVLPLGFACPTGGNTEDRGRPYAYVKDAYVFGIPIQQSPVVFIGFGGGNGFLGLHSPCILFPTKIQYTQAGSNRFFGK